VEKVFCLKESSYDYKDLRAGVYEILGRLDGGVITASARVLIKPNLLTSAKPQRAITTHPLIIRAAVEYALEMGARVQVSDSPAVGKFSSIIKGCGIEEALGGMPVRLVEFERSVRVGTDSSFKEIEIAEDALSADVVINLPKLKTHTQMGLTLAVKNLFGCVVGMRKADWHFKIGQDSERFAELLAAIHGAIKPRINLLDGILAMEGDGPGTGGTPRHIGVLMGSSNAVSLDMAVCEMLGAAPLSIATNRAAVRLGFSQEYETVGEMPLVEGFVFPRAANIVFGPAFTGKILRKHLTSRPVSDREACRLCNECVNICPAGAIENDGSRLNFDYDKCIRCYCCIEVCPHSAIKVHEPIMRKAVKRFFLRK
jgi:uncharacterized protein (DUF362 family)/Pyruvate/2-oxoacid:ferredoxin oxidoreductase delta subunit